MDHWKIIDYSIVGFLALLGGVCWTMLWITDFPPLFSLAIFYWVAAIWAWKILRG